MDKNQYNKWKDKFNNKFEFCEDMTEYPLKVNFKNHNKIFFSLTKEEYNIFNTWTKQEQLNFLNGLVYFLEVIFMGFLSVLYGVYFIINLLKGRL